MSPTSRWDGHPWLCPTCKTSNTGPRACLDCGAPSPFPEEPAVHGQGLGRDAVRTLCRHLVDARGHHRFVIDPAADNEAAIRCYRAVGFRPVGVLRRYERDLDGNGWHDGLLMDLLAEELEPGS